MTTSATMVEQSGGDKKDVRRAEMHEENVSMAGNKIFFDNISSVVMQAVLLDYDILDCVVVIDLCQAPPSIEAKLASDFFDSGDIDRDNFAHTKRICERNRRNGALTVACISLGVNGPDDANAILLKTIPSQMAPMGCSWTESQADMKESIGSMLEEMRSNTELLEELRQSEGVHD